MFAVSEGREPDLTGAELLALRVYLLGPLDLRVGDRRLPKPPTAKSQSLLAYLICHRRSPQSRDLLAGLFWGDRSERKARRSLTTALWHIRRCLPGDQLMLSDVQTVQISPTASLWLDVTHFEAALARPDLASLEAAVTLYRGDFMEAFYDDWVLNERYRLETLYTEALAHLMASLEEQRDHTRALTIARRLLLHDPLREDAHRLAMRTLCRLGQRNAALDHYRSCRQLITRELGVEPMPETSALYDAIVAGQVQVEEPQPKGLALSQTEAHEAAAQISQSAWSPLDPVLRPPLVGRETDLAALQACYAAACSGKGSLVLIRGEAGVGKTRLVDAWSTRLRWEGVRVLWGRCYEFERLLPYQPIAEALQGVLSTTAPENLAKLPAWITAVLARLVPGLPGNLQDSATGSESVLDQAPSHLFEAVARFLIALTPEAGLLLILDDLHWATESTLQLVHYLVRRLVGQRLLIVGTLRPEALTPQHPHAAFEQELRHDGFATSLDLQGLSREAVVALVAELSGRGQSSAPLAYRLYDETRGNAFFLVETLKALIEEGLIRREAGEWHADFASVSRANVPLPGGVREAIQARVDRCEHGARQVLQAAAVLGREFDLDLLSAVSNRDEEACLEALDALLRRRLVDEGSGAMGRDFAFHHHKIQEVVYAHIPLRHRQHLHAQAAAAIEARSAYDWEAAAGELAHHWDHAGLDDAECAAKATQYLLLAGDQARVIYAHAEALAYYTRALDLQKAWHADEQAARTLMKLALVHHTRFDFEAARQAFEAGFEQWQQLDRRPALHTLPPAPHSLRLRWRRPYTLDPALVATYVCRLVVEQLFVGLVAAAPDLSIVPGVARRWEVLHDGLRYRFHLRPDTKWSDGTRLTAHDFEFAWKRVLEPVTPATETLLYVIKGARAFSEGADPDPDHVGVHAVDDLTLDVELAKPVSHFLHMLTNVSASPVPRHVVTTYGKAWTEAGHMVSNGPFCLEAWDDLRGMRLVWNPHYAGPRRGNVEHVVLRFPQASATRELAEPLDQFLSGELDVLTLTDASVTEGDQIRRRYAGMYLSAPWLFTVYAGFVTTRRPCDDARVRRALTMALDREALANRILRGMYAPGTGSFTPPGMAGHIPGLGLLYDPNAARELLAAAGYGAGGYDRLPALKAVSVTPVDTRVLDFIAAQWQQTLGIAVTWDILDWSPFLQRLAHDPPHLYVLARFPSWPDPAYFVHGDDHTFTRWTHPTYESLVEAAARATKQAARLELLHQADRVLIEEAPLVPLFYGRQHLMRQPWVSRFPVSALNRWYWQDIVLEQHGAPAYPS
jgi:ABC-type oligopeptide transport system substrate-binding subunit/DNA-binding SARP family transcriptional activator/tetratricopeptide (TPR) repeat protein